MPFTKNDKNINRDGRAKGSKNKKTIWIESLKDALPNNKSLEANLALELYKIATSEETSTSDKLKALSEINKVVFNKPTESVEVDANIQDIDLSKIIKFKKDE